MILAVLGMVIFVTVAGYVLGFAHGREDERVERLRDVAARALFAKE